MVTMVPSIAKNSDFYDGKSGYEEGHPPPLLG